MSGHRQLAAAALTLALTGMLAGPAAAAEPPTVLVGPHQLFQGMVNDQASDATIQMGCFGPVTMGQTGHPLAGQTIGVKLAATPVTGPASAYGYTGDTATSIAAAQPTAAANAPIATFTFYADQALSTSLTFPCYGTAAITFAPSPNAGGQAFTLTVRFAGQP
jgi:hypothetical protein